jgi:DNA polymerase
MSAATLLLAIWRAGGDLQLRPDGRLSVRAPRSLAADITAHKAALIALLASADVYFDIETQSASDLKADGAFVYSRHSTTRILMAHTALGDADPELWLPGLPVPRAIVELARRPGWCLVVHNDTFERNHEIILTAAGWPRIPLEQRRCTMAQCRMVALPGALDKAGEVLGIVNGKDAAGRRLINKFSKPQNRAGMAKRGEAPIFVDPEDDPADFAQFVAYNRRDVVALRETDARVPALPPFEQTVWRVDARINDRGMRIDRELAAAARKVATAMVAELNAELAELTGGSVSAATQVQRLKKWCLSQGRSVTSLKAEAIADLLETTLPDAMHRALEIRLEASKASPKKLDRMLAMSAVDGRAHGCLTYYGAQRTGRWAGSGFHSPPIPQKRPAKLSRLLYCSRSRKISCQPVSRWVSMQIMKPSNEA